MNDGMLQDDMAHPATTNSCLKPWWIGHLLGHPPLSFHFTYCMIPKRMVKRTMLQKKVFRPFGWLFQLKMFVEAVFMMMVAHVYISWFSQSNVFFFLWKTLTKIWKEYRSTLVFNIHKNFALEEKADRKHPYLEFSLHFRRRGDKEGWFVFQMWKFYWKIKFNILIFNLVFE